MLFSCFFKLFLLHSDIENLPRILLYWMTYKSICCICGQETPESENIAEHDHVKIKMGFTKIQIWTNKMVGNIRSINFCPSCSKKSYTIEELKTIGNYNQWSY